ncbi:hypothetical protein [Allorhodopirellula heiligendammensis]|uniref:Uncharacterized protein n=1 Tax=Allorhodopirellula heiligendammensis TaxID=2714739 RepID=A0A5C6BFF6_9BACT|nr:hypothetical protein [Allorhodopirellula heiligendammensis]TWU10768.1 hypothetical protein Poly21_46740 [Allorhodopirellula heiligendammensis]
MSTDVKYVNVTIQTNHGLVFTVFIPANSHAAEERTSQPVVAQATGNGWGAVSNQSIAFAK